MKKSLTRKERLLKEALARPGVADTYIGPPTSMYDAALLESLSHVRPNDVNDYHAMIMTLGGTMPGVKLTKTKKREMMDAMMRLAQVGAAYYMKVRQEP